MVFFSVALHLRLDQRSLYRERIEADLVELVQLLQNALAPRGPLLVEGLAFPTDRPEEAGLVHHLGTTRDLRRATFQIDRGCLGRQQSVLTPKRHGDTLGECRFDTA